MQTSHLLMKSVLSRVDPDQVGSPCLTLKGKLEIVILGKEIENLLRDRSWSRKIGHNFKDAQGRVAM